MNFTIWEHFRFGCVVDDWKLSLAVMLATSSVKNRLTSGGPVSMFYKGIMFDWLRSDHFAINFDQFLTWCNFESLLMRMLLGKSSSLFRFGLTATRISIIRELITNW